MLYAVSWKTLIEVDYHTYHIQRFHAYGLLKCIAFMDTFFMLLKIRFWFKVYLHNSFPLWTYAICCFIEDINWSGLPQISHSKGFLHMVYFLHNLIQYAYWNYHLQQILYDKVHMCMVHCFHGHILCAVGYKILV